MSKKILSNLIIFILVLNIGVISVSAQAGIPESGVLTFAQLNHPEIFLDGPYDSLTFSFGLPPYWQLTGGAEINLNFTVTFNTVLLGNEAVTYGGTFTVYFNKAIVAVIPLNDVGTFDYTVQIPFENLASQRTDGRMELRFELDSGISCLANQHMNVVVNGSSRINLPHDDVQPSVDLINFPSPLYQSSIFPDEALIVIPDQPDVAELRGAITIAAGLGNLTSENLLLDLVQIGQLTEDQQMANHIIFVGKSASLPVLADLSLPLPVQKGGFSLPDGSPDDGVIEMISSPWNTQKVVLVVSGNTGEGVVKAAQAVSTGTLYGNSVSNLAIVDTVRDAAIAVPLISDQTLGDLGYEQRILTNRGIDSESFSFYVDPGRAVSSDSYFELAYGHSALLNYEQSGLIVFLNGTPIGSVRFSDVTAGEAVNRTQIFLPSSVLLPGNNVLEVRSSLEAIDNCTDPNLRSLWATVWPESRLYLPLGSVQVNSVPALNLDVYPIPMVLDPSLNTTAFILPRDDLQTWKLAIRVAAYLGNSSDGPISIPNVFLDGQISSDELKNYHVIILGQPRQLTVMSELNNNLPIPFETGTNNLQDVYSQVIYRTSPDVPFGYVEFLSSPWNSEKIVIAAFGNSPQGVTWAASSLVDVLLRGQLAGNFALIDLDRVETLDTRLGIQIDGAGVPLDGPTIVAPASPTVPAQQSASRPAWILLTIQVVAGLILLVLLFVIITNVRRTRR